MKLSEIKELKELLENDWREAVEEMEADTDDFECGNYRFISEHIIDKIMIDELSGDVYTLGCFQPHFISDVTGIDYDIVERAQRSESYEFLCELMLKNIEEVQKKYVSDDGYGHHFAHYDGHEIELNDYYVFKIN